MDWPMKIAVLAFVASLFCNALAKRARHWNEAIAYRRYQRAALALALTAVAFVTIWFLTL